MPEDCTYYICSLAVLAAFTYNQLIEAWEVRDSTNQIFFFFFCARRPFCLHYTLVQALAISPTCQPCKAGSVLQKLMLPRLRELHVREQALERLGVRWLYESLMGFAVREQE